MKRSFVTTTDLTPEEFEKIISLAQHGKEERWKRYSDALAGLSIGLVFLNSSLRTRASFQAGIEMLGGKVTTLNPGSESYAFEYEEGVVMNGSTVEHIKDAVRVLSRYFDALCIRSFAHPSPTATWEDERQDRILTSILNYTDAPVVNMESVLWHPCQAMADALTIREALGDTPRKRFVLSWCDHPKPLCMAVPNSALLMAAQLGMEVTLACPPGYELDQEIMGAARHECERNGASFSVENSQCDAFDGAEVVYAKSWTPPYFVGRRSEELAFLAEQPSWRVTGELMKRTREAIFMHCLPVRRNVEVTDEVLDSSYSRIYDQAENRLHAQNALLLQLLKGGV